MMEKDFASTLNFVILLFPSPNITTACRESQNRLQNL